MPLEEGLQSHGGLGQSGARRETVRGCQRSSSCSERRYHSMSNRTAARVEAPIGAPAQEHPQVRLGMQPGLAAVEIELRGRSRTKDDMIVRYGASIGCRKGSHTSPCVTAKMNTSTPGARCGCQDLQSDAAVRRCWAGALTASVAVGRPLNGHDACDPGDGDVGDDRCRRFLILGGPAR
jgi:hypothetical protein